MTRCHRVAALVLWLALLACPMGAHADLSRVSREALARIAAAGPGARVVVDVDNTVGDTRYRTRAAAEIFARRHASARALARLPIGRVGWNGRLTALGAGLDAATAEQFQSYWDRFFWSPRNFKLDRKMRSTIALVKAARDAGAEVFYLTGRVSALKGGTIRELNRLGLPDVDRDHVLCKSEGVSTTAFKRERLLELGTGRRRVAWFLSDSAAELNAVADLVHCIAVKFPVRSPGDTAFPGAATLLRYGRR